MKQLIVSAALLLSALQVGAAEKKVFRISTEQTDLILQVGDNGRLYQTYLGKKLLNENDIQNLSWDIHAGSDGSVSKRGWEVYSGSGNEEYFEPAIAVTHNDGNNSTYLYYVSSSTEAVDGGTKTTINLRDDQYPVEVALHYVAYPKENVIKTWSEIKHQEASPVILSTYASTMLYFNSTSYYLTEFSSDWAKEAQMSSQQLQFGKKVIDTKLGSRAAMLLDPATDFAGIGLAKGDHCADLVQCPTEPGLYFSSKFIFFHNFHHQHPFSMGSRPKPAPRLASTDYHDRTGFDTGA